MADPLHDARLSELAREVARELPGTYAKKARKNLSEQFHLQPTTNRVVERLAATWHPTPSLVGKTFGDKLGWIGLGHVDTVFSWADGTRLFLELKCGTDLSACAWDAVKLASGVLNGNAFAGYMLAGSPSSLWRKPIPGAELFERGKWHTTGVRDAHLKWWRFWQGEKTPHIPGRVAASFETVQLGLFPFAIDGVAWELRLVRVEPSGPNWLNWELVGG